jgi:hypothetical protein
MGQPIDLKQSVHALCTAHPEIMDIMVSLGFADIVKPGMLGTAGRIMTVEKGARMKGIPMDTILQAFQAHGFDATTTEGGQPT